MKKLGILVMALLLVVGMSLGVMAEDINVAQNLDSDINESVEVGVKVNQYAEVILENARARSNDDVLEIEGERKIVDLLDLGNPDEHAIGWDLSVKSNDNVDITVQEDVSRTLADDSITPYRLDGGTNTDWVVAPNVELFDTNWSNHPDGGFGSAWENGSQYELAGVSNFNGVLQFNAQISEDRFEDAVPGRYDGTVYVIVSAH